VDSVCVDGVLMSIRKKEGRDVRRLICRGGCHGGGYVKDRGCDACVFGERRGNGCCVFISRRGKSCL
jgi:hypothetical protein